MIISMVFVGVRWIHVCWEFPLQRQIKLHNNIGLKLAGLEGTKILEVVKRAKTSEQRVIQQRSFFSHGGETFAIPWDVFAISWDACTFITHFLRSIFV